MKKFFSVFIAAAIAVCMCIPLAACGDDNNKTETPTKRIIGLDSEKTYAKGKYYFDTQSGFHEKDMYLPVSSYDKIEEKEIENIMFDISPLHDIPTVGGQRQLISVKLSAYEFGIKFDATPDNNGIYDYLIYIMTDAREAGYGFRIKSINIIISGKEYKFTSDIEIVGRSNIENVRPLIFSNAVYGGTTEKGEYSVLLSTRYDMTLKSLKFQADGFNITSYYAEIFGGYDEFGNEQDGEKVADSLPFELKADTTYNIYVKTTSPNDCLYYNCDFEVVVEYQGIEMVYYNSAFNFSFAKG